MVIAYNSLVKTKESRTDSAPIIIEKIVEKPIEIVKNVFKEFKRGTKRVHNERLADPNLPENQTDRYLKKTYK